MSIVALLVACLIVGFLLYIIRTVPVIDPWIKNIMYGLVCIVFIIWLLQGFGLLAGSPVVLK